MAHDRFQEIVDEANRPDSVVRLTQVILDPATDLQKTKTVVAQPKIEEQLAAADSPVFTSEVERKIAEATYQVIGKYENLPTSSYLLKPEVQARIAEEVKEYVTPGQQALPGMVETPNIADVVAKTTELVVQRMIDIPRILVVPRGDVTTGFHAFALDCSGIHYQPVARDLLIQHLRTNQQETLSFGGALPAEQRLEDYIVRGLIDFDDISYDDHADLLYDLAGQLVRHLRSYLSEEDARNVLIYYQKPLAAFVHAQMQEHQWEKATGYDVVVSKGFTALKPCAYTAKDGEPIHDFRQTVGDRTRISQMLFGGFQRSLYSIQKFDSDTERRLAVILDRDSEKWFKPAQGQFQISYKVGVDHREYVPDFVAETADCLYLLEPKARNEMTDPEVLAKKDAAVLWCARATDHALGNGGKPWQYVLIPHDVIAENMTLAGLVTEFSSP